MCPGRDGIARIRQCGRSACGVCPRDAHARVLSSWLQLDSLREERVGPSLRECVHGPLHAHAMPPSA